jgi:uncharacterized protein (DUF2267 family)
MEAKMQEDELIERVRARLGDASAWQAAQAIEATLATLGERMRTVDACAVASELPPRFAAALTRRPCARLAALSDVYQGVARREHVPLPSAMLHAQAVCRALCELLGEQMRAQLSIRVWPQLLRPSFERSS